MADNNNQGVETRSRSRSKTPLRVMETRQGTKIPNVQTIDEDIEPPTTPVLRTSTRIKDVVKDNHKIETVNSSRVIEETLVTSTTTVVTSTAKKEGKKTDTAKKVSKVVASNSGSNFGSKSKEMSDNDKNALLETSIEAITRSTSSENLANGNGSGTNIAYLVYKEAGEYWNKFPKTDYTYSELSPHRREIAPGQVIMPNMSRGSLDKHHSRVEYMIQKSPEQAAYIRERYQARTARTAPRPNLEYDSGDELDYSQFERKRQAEQSSKYAYTTTTITTRFKRAVTTIITTIYIYITSLFSLSSANSFNKTQNLYYTRQEERKSLLSRFVSLVTSIWLSVLRRCYVIISSLLTIDTWLLMSRSSALMGERKRRFLLLLLFLLPLLLFGGFLFYHDPDFTASVKNSIYAWQQSITAIFVSGYEFVKEKLLTIISLLNIGKFYDAVVPVAESSKVVLHQYSKYCIDVYQSAVNYGCDIWNENFKSGATVGAVNGGN